MRAEEHRGDMQKVVDPRILPIVVLGEGRKPINNFVVLFNEKIR